MLGPLTALISNNKIDELLKELKGSSHVEKGYCNELDIQLFHGINN